MRGMGGEIMIKKVMVKKDMSKKDMSKKVMVKKDLIKSPKTKDSENDLKRVPREDITDNINEAIEELEAANHSVSIDRLKRAEEEIDRALRILLKAQRQINMRRNWFISE
jgi:hypothetical protein